MHASVALARTVEAVLLAPHPAPTLQDCRDARWHHALTASLHEAPQRCRACTPPGQRETRRVLVPASPCCGGKGGDAREERGFSSGIREV